MNSDVKPLRRTNVLILFKENSIPPCRAGPPARVHLTNFHPAGVGSQLNQVISPLGGLACFSYERIILL